MHALTPILCGHWDEPSEQAAAPSAEGFLHTRRPADQASQTSQGRDNRLIRRRWSLLAGRSWPFKMNRDMEGEGAVGPTSANEGPRPSGSRLRQRWGRPDGPPYNRE